MVDAATRKVVATIPLPGKPEFPAVDGKGTVFDNIEDKNEIVRLDAHARKVTAEWPVGCDSPSGLAFDVAGHRLFSVCDGKKMAVVDSNTGKCSPRPPSAMAPMRPIIRRARTWLLRPAVTAFSLLSMLPSPTTRPSNRCPPSAAPAP